MGALLPAGRAHQEGVGIDHVEGEADGSERPGGQQPCGLPGRGNELGQGQGPVVYGDQYHAEDHHPPAAPAPAQGPGRQAGQGKGQRAERDDQPDKAHTVAQAQQVEIEQHIVDATRGREPDQGAAGQVEPHVAVELAQHVQVRSEHGIDVFPGREKYCKFRGLNIMFS